MAGRQIRKVRREARVRLGNLSEWCRVAFGRPGARVGAAFHRPTDMCEPDRIMIYALIRGLRPSRVLEIGVRWGGSARTACAAMEDNRHGRMVGLDPETDAFRAPKRALHGRYELVQGYSPQDIPKAVERLGGPPDLVFIDAMHIHACAAADLRGALRAMQPGGHVLLHDSFHPGVDRAVRDCLEEHPALTDCGLLTRHARASAPVAGQGLRLLRVGAPVEEADLRAGFELAGVAFPPDPSRFYNYDKFAIRIGMVRESEGRYEFVPPAPPEERG
ncbi:MAG: class I SAM-dependent methyltransferase [Planctomycetes bacterium]|nr:class I SAM-dependent methyltransferase [Planctomycetota bacterium]